MKYEEEVERGAEIADSLADDVTSGNLRKAHMRAEAYTNEDLVLGLVFLSRVTGIAAKSSEILGNTLKARQAAISNITEEA